MARPHNPRRAQRRRRPERDQQGDSNDDGGTSERDSSDAESEHDFDDTDGESVQLSSLSMTANASICSWWPWALLAALVAALVSLRLGAGLNIDAFESGGDNDVDFYSVLNVGASSSQVRRR